MLGIPKNKKEDLGTEKVEEPKLDEPPKPTETGEIVNVVRLDYALGVLEEAKIKLQQNIIELQAQVDKNAKQE